MEKTIEIDTIVRQLSTIEHFCCPIQPYSITEDKYIAVIEIDDFISVISLHNNELQFNCTGDSRFLVAENIKRKISELKIFDYLVEVVQPDTFTMIFSSYSKCKPESYKTIYPNSTVYIL